MQAPPPPYAPLQPTGYAPPYHPRRVPQYGQPKRSTGHCCLKCICCCYCLLFLLIIVLAGLTFYFFTAYKPQVPSYKVKSMDVRSFEALKDYSIKVDLIVHAEANNPNSHISFNYGEDSAVVVLYRDASLCSGKLPAFEQGTNNITIMNIEMTGKNGFGSGLQEALQENQKSGKIPLVVTVKAPISIVVGSLRLRQFTVHVKCSLVIDSLSAGKKPRIVSSSYDVDASF